MERTERPHRAWQNPAVIQKVGRAHHGAHQPVWAVGQQIGERIGVVLGVAAFVGGHGAGNLVVHLLQGVRGIKCDLHDGLRRVQRHILFDREAEHNLVARIDSPSAHESVDARILREHPHARRQHHVHQAQLGHTGRAAQIADKAFQLADFNNLVKIYLRVAPHIHDVRHHGEKRVGADHAPSVGTVAIPAFARRTID